MSRRTKPVLPGLSRSTACTKTKSCARLDGHRRRCRTTLTVTKSPAMVVKAAPTKSVVEKGVEVLSADRYTVQPSAPATKRPASASKRKAQPTKSACRVAKDGIRCDRLFGHKVHGLRHRFTGRVVNLPEAEAPRMVADSSNGGHRFARRPKAAPAGRRDITIAEALA